MRTHNVMKSGFSKPLAAGLLVLLTGTLSLLASASEREDRGDAIDLVKEAAAVAKQIRTDKDESMALASAKGVFIVPDYARVSLGVGAAGGQGVLVAQNDGKWSAPAFYNIGSLNVGLAAGVEAGSIAFILMSDKAMSSFRQENNFSLNADAGLTIVDWSKRAQASAGKGDVVVWSDTEGLYGNLSVNVSDIMWDEEANRAYYAKDVSATDILNGSVQSPEGEGQIDEEFALIIVHEE